MTHRMRHHQNPIGQTDSMADPASGSKARKFRFGAKAAAILFGVALLASACSSGTGSSTTTTSGGGTSGGSTVTIENFAFSPSTLTVHPGQTVTVTNKDGTIHTVTSLTHKFDTGQISPGQSATFTAPTSAGRYSYQCSIHPFMTGTLVVS